MLTLTEKIQKIKTCKKSKNAVYYGAKVDLKLHITADNRARIYKNRLIKLNPINNIKLTLRIQYK